MARISYTVILLTFIGLVAGGSYYLQTQVFNPERSPFTAIDWKEGRPQVRLDEKWYALQSIAGIPVMEIIEHAHSTYRQDWQRRFEDRLAGILTELGQRPWRTVDLEVTMDEKIKRFVNRPITVENQQRVRNYRLGTRERIIRARPAVQDSLLPHITRRFDSRYKVLHTDKAKTGNGNDTDPPTWLSQQAATADIERLEYFLFHHYSAPTRHTVQFPALLDAIYNDLGNGISRRDFAIQIQRLLSLFEDPGNFVDFTANNIDMPDRELPLAFQRVGDNVAVLNRANKRLLTPDYPFLRQINGKPLEEWLEAGSHLTSGGGTDQQSIDLLKSIELLGRELSGHISSNVSLGLESADGMRSFIRSVRLEKISAKEKPGGRLPNSAGLTSTPGYLAMTNSEGQPVAIDSLIARALSQSEAGGLILDMRGYENIENELTSDFLPHLMPSSAAPQIVRMSALRMNRMVNPGHPEGYMANQGLYPATASIWTEIERDVISKTAQQFTPDALFDTRQYSDWHFQIVKPVATPTALSGIPLVVLHDGESSIDEQMFLSTLKSLPNAQFIGKVARCGERNTPTFTLQNSQLKIHLSRTLSLHPGGELFCKKVVQADIPYDPTLADLTGKSDGALARAKDLLHNNSGGQIADGR